MTFIAKHKLVSCFTLIGLCFFLLVGCINFSNEGIVNVDADSLILDQELGLVHYNGKPFSGAGVSYFKDGKKAESNKYIFGKRQGLRTKWFSNGEKSYVADYKNGKLDGFSKSWWNNGAIRSQSNFKEGLLEGEQKKWFKSGSVFKIQNYSAGKESGMQKAFRENGKIYANYEAKNGGVFGLKRSNLCYDLEDEKIK